MGKIGVASIVISLCLLSAVWAADFNGDGTEDVFIFNSATGLWAVRGVTRTYFGRDGDLPVPGDYDASGIDRPAVFRPGSGLWAVSGLTRLYFGGSSDRPIPQDYSGDGKDDFAIFRPSGGLWAVRRVTRVYFGGEGDIPVPGAYGTARVCQPAIFRPATGLWTARGVSRIYFGGGSDTPVPGDYNGSGVLRPAVFRAGSGMWGVWGLTRFYFGRSGDQPHPGDYTGNGADEFKIFRPSNGLWAARGVTRFYFGGPAVPSPPPLQWRDGYDVKTFPVSGGVFEFMTRNIRKPTTYNKPGDHEYIIVRLTGDGMERLLIMTMYARPARIFLDGAITDNRFEQPLPGPSHWRVSSNRSRMWIELDGREIWSRSGPYYIKQAIMAGYDRRGFLGEWAVEN